MTAIRIASPLADHVQRLNIARGVSERKYGEPSYADEILSTYCLPTGAGSYDYAFAAEAPEDPDAIVALGLPADADSPFTDHARRLEAARNTAYYSLGEEGCADEIVGVYFAPSTAVLVAA